MVKGCDALKTDTMCWSRDGQEWCWESASTHTIGCL